MIKLLITLINIVIAVTVFTFNFAMMCSVLYGVKLLFKDLTMLNVVMFCVMTGIANVVILTAHSKIIRPLLNK